MNRERLFKMLLGILILLLIFLLFKFKPSFQGPKKLEKIAIEEGRALLSAKGYKYEVKAKNTLKYTVIADEVLESGTQTKELKGVQAFIPRGEDGFDKIVSKKGLFNESSNELRIFDDAKIFLKDGTTILSDAFRITEQAEILSEGKAYFSKEKMNGTSDILRYDKEKKIIYMEGNVNIVGEDLSFFSKRVTVDLENHNGKIEGPISAIKNDFKISSPDGVIFLNEQNKLKAIDLNEPVKGETSSLFFSSKTAQFLFDDKGDCIRTDLNENVQLTSKSDSTSKMLTDKLVITRIAKDLSGWNAPKSLKLTKNDFIIDATSGSGNFKSNSVTGTLKGPIRGHNEDTEISSTSAEIREEAIDFIGNAEAVQNKNSIMGEKITSMKNGGYYCVGNVRGRNENNKGEVINFECYEATMSKRRYPTILKGNCKIFESTFILKGSQFTMVDENSLTGCNGVDGEFTFDKGKVFAHGLEMTYKKDKGFCLFKQNPYATNGSDKLQSDETMSVYMDKENKIEKIVAEGKAIYEGENLTVKGEIITYKPKTKEGEAFSEIGVSEAKQKKPYRRVTNKTILFKEKEIVAKGLENMNSRGRIEGEEEKKR